MRINLPPGAFGLTDRETGRTYADRDRADRSHTPRIGSVAKRRQRSVEITNPAHLAAIKANPLLGTPGYYLNGTGWDCTCGHGCWPWQQVCTLCGTERAAGSG